MNIVGIGTDIVSIDRLRKARHIDRVADYILCSTEHNEYTRSADKAQYLASRLAVKESVIKAYPGTLSYHDIVIHKDGRKPIATLINSTQTKYSVAISLAHEEQYALGYSVISLQK